MTFLDALQGVAYVAGAVVVWGVVLLVFGLLVLRLLVGWKATSSVRQQLGRRGVDVDRLEAQGVDLKRKLAELRAQERGR